MSESRYDGYLRRIMALPPGERSAALAAFDAEVDPYDWDLHARPEQRQPEGNWRIWVIRTGRGWGKGRAAAEAVRERVQSAEARSVLLIGTSHQQVRDVMVPTLLDCHRADERPEVRWNSNLLRWPNGAIGYLRTAEEPDPVRGLNLDLLWGDEPSYWSRGADAWTALRYAIRVGDPRVILTGTPRAEGAWLRDIEDLPGTVVTTGSTHENRHLSAEFVASLDDDPSEVHGEYVTVVEGAAWVPEWIDHSRFAGFNPDDPWASLEHGIARQPSDFGLPPQRFGSEARRWRTVVGVDPNRSGKGDECGIVVATAPERAQWLRDHVVVLADRSTAGGPHVWAKIAADAYRHFDADRIVAEGAEDVRVILHAVDSTVNVELVTPTLSKMARAEPVATAYERGWVHHAGTFRRLEAQQVTWVPGSRSPDRLDALVYAVCWLVPPGTRKRAARFATPSWLASTSLEMTDGPRRAVAG